MSNQETLQHATRYFKQYYSSLPAEAVVCFLVRIGLEDGASISDVASMTGMAEPTCYQYLAQLTVGVGAGLIRFENIGAGKVVIHLTPAGEAAKEAVLNALE